MSFRALLRFISLLNLATLAAGFYPLPPPFYPPSYPPPPYYPPSYPPPPYYPPSYPPSFPPSYPPSYPPSFPPSYPPSYPPSFPPSYPPSYPPSSPSPYTPPPPPLSFMMDSSTLDMDMWTWLTGSISGAGTSYGVYGSKGLGAAQNTPGSREGFGMVIDQDSFIIYLFGGRAYDNRNSPGLMNDMWSYSIFTGYWIFLSGNPQNAVLAPKLLGIPRQFNDTNNPGARRDFGMTFFRWDKAVYVFGGLDGNNVPQNDLWMYSVELNQWALATQPEPAVTARYGATLTAIDETSIYLFGAGGGLNSFLTIGYDLWIFNIQKNMQQYHWFQPPVSTAQQSPARTLLTRRFHSAVYVAEQNSLYVFGGQILNGGMKVNQLLQFNRQNMDWSSIYIQPNNPQPQERSGHGMDYDAKNQCLVVFGGADSQGQTLNDFWCFYPTSQTWNMISGDYYPNSLGFYGTRGIPSSQNKPAARTNISIVVAQNLPALFSFGGAQQENSYVFNDLWKFGKTRFNSISAVEPLFLRGVGGIMNVTFWQPVPLSATVTVHIGSDLICNNPSFDDTYHMSCNYPPRLTDKTFYDLAIVWGGGALISQHTVTYRPKPNIVQLMSTSATSGGNTVPVTGINFGDDPSVVTVWMTSYDDPGIRYQGTEIKLESFGTDRAILTFKTPTGIDGAFYITVEVDGEETLARPELLFKIGTVNVRPKSQSFITDTLQNEEKIIDLTDMITASDKTAVSLEISSLPMAGTQSAGILYQYTNGLSAPINSVPVSLPTGSFQLKFAPKLHFNGEAKFSYRAKGTGTWFSNSSTVTVNVKFVDQPPVDLNPNQRLVISTANQQTPLKVELSVSDIDEKNGFSLMIDVPPDRGQWFLDELMTQPMPQSGELFIPLQSSVKSSINFYVRPDQKGGTVNYTTFAYRIKDIAQNVIGPNFVGIQVSCPAGEYPNIWSQGSPCKPCPPGALCSDQAAFYPTNLLGFFPESGFVFVPCLPASACPPGTPIPYGITQNFTAISANNTFECAPGYTGQRCGTCASKFYSKGGSCVACPVYDFNPVLIAAVILIGLLAIMYFANILRKLDIGFIGILINYWQIIAVFQTFNLRWPTAVTQLYHYFSFLYFNVELASPECFVGSGPSVAYELKWFGTLALPIALVFLCFVLIAANEIIRFIISVFKKLFFGTTDRQKNYVVSNNVAKTGVIGTAEIAESRPSTLPALISNDDSEPELFNQFHEGDDEFPESISSKSSQHRRSSAASHHPPSRKVSVKSIKQPRKLSAMNSYGLKNIEETDGKFAVPASPKLSDDVSGRRMSTQVPGSSSRNPSLVAAPVSIESKAKEDMIVAMEPVMTPLKAKPKIREKKSTEQPSMWSIMTGSYSELNDEERGGGDTSFSITLFSIFLLLLKLAYISVAQKSLELFDCTYNDVTKYYIYDAETSRRCYDPWWYRLLPFSVAGIIFYVIGIPSLFLWLFFKRRRLLKIKKANRTFLQQFIVQATYKKKSEFKPEAEYWDSVLLFRKLAIITCQLYFTRFIAFQSLAVIIVFIVFLYPQASVAPYQIQSINRLEAGTLLSSAIVLMCGIMFYIQEFTSQAQLDLLGYAVILIIAFTSLLVIIFLVLHLRYMYLKYQQDKRCELAQKKKEQAKIIQAT